MQVTLNLQQLTEYGIKILKQPGTLERVSTSKLNGGFVATAVYRHDLIFRQTDGSVETISVVQKYTMPARSGLCKP